MPRSLRGHNIELRRHLIIENETVSGHWEGIQGLKRRFPHTIRSLERPEHGTCLTYALNLLDRHSRLCEEWQSLDIKPGEAFVHWLMDSAELDEITRMKAGALALYFDGEHWKHAGIVQKHDRIASKWGAYAVYDHGISEVPENYGDTVRFFRMPSADEAARLFFDYGCWDLDASAEHRETLRRHAGMAK